MNPPGHWKRTIKYDLNVLSLPWMLYVPIKPGKQCERLSDLELELQLMTVNFVLSAIIWGDGKSHFVGISIDLNRENHIFYDAMAPLRMVVYQHNKSLSSIAAFGGLLQLLYVKKA